ncbi:MAG: response regulator [Bacteroidales bacterium]|nr:response regulator [Bacteroidales bacterium]
MKTSKNLLLVDDDQIFVYLTKRTIKETKLTVKIEVFENGKDAIEFLKKVADNKDLLPQIIFLDLAMPILDGWGFLEEFSELEQKLKSKVTLYVLSSSFSAQDQQRVKKYSFVSDYFVKPITSSQFIDIVEKF